MNQQVLDAIEAERAIVRAGIATEGQDDVLSPAEWVALITRHMGLALPHQRGEAVDEARVWRQAIRVAWLTVAWAEALERREARRKQAGPDDATRTSWKGW